MNINLATVTPVDVLGFGGKVLAVIGGAVVFGFVAGLVARMLMRGLTTQPMPQWATRIVRLVGAVAGGWLVALIVFGDGSGGLGGGGGGTPGGTKDAEKDGKPIKKTEPASTTKENTQTGGGHKMVRVTVLHDDVLKKITMSDKPNQASRYRIEGESTTALRTLAEIKEELLKRQKEQKDLKVDVILYKDSLPKFSQEVRQLVDDFLVKEKLFKDWNEPPEHAPR